MKPTVSLVICTRNRAQRLRACLDAVARIETKIPWELVLVDNGSTDETKGVAESFAAAASFPVQVIVEPARGSGHARNTGWRNSRGDLIGFTDDDCYVCADYIDRVLEVFADRRVGYAGGRITLFDARDYPLTIQLHASYYEIPPRSYIAAGALQGANMIFRRSALEQINGFDGRFGAGAEFAGDDVDAEARASFCGWFGVYDPRLVVAHHHGRNAAQARKLYRRYDIGRGAYFAKFLLRGDTRREFARNIYWAKRRDFEPRYIREQFAFKVRAVFQEIEGALRYLLHHGFSDRQFTRSSVPSF